MCADWMNPVTLSHSKAEEWREIMIMKNKIINEKIEHLIVEINKFTDGSELQKILYLQNFLLANVKYPHIKLKNEDGILYPKLDLNDDIQKNYSTSYGGLINKKVFCFGIAETVNLILNNPKIDIKSETVNGYCVSPQNGKIIHAWNIVFVENMAYQLDTTFDITRNVNVKKFFDDKLKIIDDKNEIAGAKATKFSYERFLVSDKHFESDHIWNKSYPICNLEYSRGKIKIAIEQLKAKGVKFDYTTEK
ncbi:hypothetical protein FACS1894198_3580 [Clostridia bacterium]|nr:hypothetical protein FACS1894198_3580 [Clostridia bacterium]